MINTKKQYAGPQSAIGFDRPGWTDETAPPDWSQWIGRAVTAIAVIMALYVGVGFWTGWNNVWRAIREMPVDAVPKAVALVLLGLALRAGRWHYYTRRLRWDVPFGQSMVAFLASFAFTATPGKLGEVVKSVLLRRRYGVSLTEGFGVLLVERLGDLLAVLILAAGGLALLTDELVSFILSASLIGLVTVFVGFRTIHQPVLRFFSRVPKLGGLANRGLAILAVGQVLLRPVPFLVGVALALVAWGCEGLAFHVIARACGIQVSLLTSCCVFGVSTLIGALSALPGGLGSMEVVMVVMLSRLGISAGDAAIPVVVFRVATLWFGSLLGLAALFGWWAFCSNPSVNDKAKPLTRPGPESFPTQPTADHPKPDDTARAAHAACVSTASAPPHGNVL